MKLIAKALRGVLFTLGVLALGCLIAACGSGSSTSSSTTTSASAAGAGAGAGANGRPNPARRAALVACLKQHGVTLPALPPGTGSGAPGDGTGNGTNGTSTTPRRGFFGGRGFATNPKTRAALQACGARFGFGGGRFRGTLARANITKYVTCVRQHGYNLPNPNFSGNGSVFPSKIRTNPKFQAASRACQSLLVRPPRSVPSGGAGTTAGA